MIDLIVRNAVESDVPSLVALIESAYRGEGSKEGWTTEADLLGGQRIDAEMAREMILDPAGRVVLVFRADVEEPVATVNIRDEGRYAYFGTFAVTPRAQGGGLGRRVMALAQEAAREEWGSTGFRLTVIRQRVDLIAFYERCGFALTGRTEPFPYGQERFGIPKVDDLEFLEMVREFD